MPFGEQTGCPAADASRVDSDSDSASASTGCQQQDGDDDAQAGSRFATSFDMRSARDQLYYPIDEFDFLIDEFGFAMTTASRFRYTRCAAGRSGTRLSMRRSTKSDGETA